MCYTSLFFFMKETQDRNGLSPVLLPVLYHVPRILLTCWLTDCSSSGLPHKGGG